MKHNFELIIDSIPYLIVTGIPIRNSNNEIVDFEISFVNSAMKKITEDSVEAGMRISQLWKNSENSTGFLEKAKAVAEGTPLVDEHYFSKKHNLWFKIDMFYIQEEDFFVTTLTDITADKNFSKQLQTALMTDSLTGLYNRNGLFQYMEKVLNEDEKNQKCTGIAILDIDNLKNINDSLGEKEGDDLIVKIANILIGFKSENYKVFRYGGDEFIIIMSNLTDEDEVAYIIDDLYNLLQTNKVKLSGGIAVSPVHSCKKEELIRYADMALCYAKKNGKNNLTYFEKYLEKAFLRHLTLETKMHTALKESAFKQYYQPQFDVHTGKLRGFEALIRWNDSELGDIPPSVFIPIAEETGLIVSIGNWVLETALETIKDWQERFNFNGIMSINVSPLQLSQDNFIFELSSMIEKYGVNPALLEIEITEGVMISHMNETIDKLQAIKDMGIKVSLDDFGTGYSSLSYLQMLPLNTLKIDKSFINNITSSDGIQANITSSIINMVKNMGLETIAEGVEQPEQLALLQKFNCNIVQGYLRGKPMPLNLCEEYLSGNEKALLTINSL